MEWLVWAGLIVVLLGFTYMLIMGLVEYTADIYCSYRLRALKFQKDIAELQFEIDELLPEREYKYRSVVIPSDKAVRWTGSTGPAETPLGLMERFYPRIEWDDKAYELLEGDGTAMDMETGEIVTLIEQ